MPELTTDFRDEDRVQIEQVVYGAISHGLIANEIMLPREVRASIRDHVMAAITAWLTHTSTTGCSQLHTQRTDL